MSNLPINHLISTLQRCCGKYEILSHTSSMCAKFRAVVKQQATGNNCVIHFADGVWSSAGQLGNFLASRLNGLTRDDSGSLQYDHDCVPGVE